MSSAIDEIYRRMNDDTEAPEIDLSDSKIREFYAGKKLLLSGATGYVGRVFIEKILRDCPEIERLYVIVREKKGVAPEDKMKKYFQNVIFDKIRATDPNFTDKVTTINGDLQVEKLGLSPEDRLTLTENLDLIVHTAATTKFDEKVSVALRINVLGTKNMLDLAADCRKLRAFVHVSTGYSHCYRRDIEERFYDSPADLEKVHELIARDEADNVGLGGEELKRVLGKWPNIYVYSKAIAEGLAKQYGEKADFAVAVYRPTIILAARREPLPGWVDASNAMTLVYLGIGLGVLHALYFDEKRIVDAVPVDLTVNALIAVVYDVGERWKVTKTPAVYNYGSRTTNPMTSNYFHNWLASEPKIGSTRLLWYPFVVITPNLYLFWIYHVLFHFVPALLADAVFLCTGKKPKALKTFFFVTKNLSVLEYFGNGDWRIHTERTLSVYDRLSKADQTIFDFDIRKLDWQFLAVLFTRGARLHILKEPLDNVELTQKRFVRLKILHYVVATLFFTAMGYLAMKLSVCAYDCFVG